MSDQAAYVKWQANDMVNQLLQLNSTMSRLVVQSDIISHWQITTMIVIHCIFIQH